jgi:hypothetical protein
MGLDRRQGDADHRHVERVEEDDRGEDEQRGPATPRQAWRDCARQN